MPPLRASQRLRFQFESPCPPHVGLPQSLVDTGSARSALFARRTNAMYISILSHERKRESKLILIQNAGQISSRNGIEGLPGLCRVGRILWQLREWAYRYTFGRVERLGLASAVRSIWRLASCLFFAAAYTSSHGTGNFSWTPASWTIANSGRLSTIISRGFPFATIDVAVTKMV